MRLRAAATVILVLLTAIPAARAEVTLSDIRAAEARVDEARADAADLADAYDAAVGRQAEIKNDLQQLINDLSRTQAELDEARERAKTTVDELYMSAGQRTSVAVVLDATPAQAAVRLVYVGRANDADREMVNALESVRKDHERRRLHLQAKAAEAAEVEQELASLRESGAARLADAEAELESLRTQYAAEQEAKRRQEEERRRREAAAAAAAAAAAEAEAAAAQQAAANANSTSTGTGSNSSGSNGSGGTQVSQPPPPAPVSGGSFMPSVERWRPLVAQYFPAGRVDAALTVMTCESKGNPNARNPYTGASGLFQHLPRYWPERARAVGFAGASPYHAEANIAAAAYLVRVSISTGLPAWYFWTCKP